MVLSAVKRQYKRSRRYDEMNAVADDTVRVGKTVVNIKQILQFLRRNNIREP